MPSLNVGLVSYHNHFDSDICLPVETRNLMCVEKDLSGDGIGSFLGSLFSKGMRAYRKAKPYVTKGIKAYNTAKEVAGTARDIYQSDAVQSLRQQLPPSVRQREQQIIQKATPFVAKAQQLERQAKSAYQKAQPIVQTGLQNYQKVQGIADKVDKHFGWDKKGSGLCGVDKLKHQLLALEKKKSKKGRGHCGSGTVLAGNGTRLAGEGWNDVLKFGLEMVPHIIDGISTASQLSGKGKNELINLTQQHLRPILSGVKTPKQLASAVITPLKLIHQSGSGRGRKNTKGAKMLKQFEKEIEQKLKMAKIARQQGRGVSADDVLGTIGNVASTILPFLLL